MTTPRIVIVGAPNTGKSTLFNRLVGRREALVHREPGMTRDIRERRSEWDGVAVVLVDTGGVLEAPNSWLDDAIRHRVLQTVLEATVVLFVVDARAGLTAQDEILARLLREANRPIVLTVNKIDTPQHRVSLALGEFHALGLSPVMAISAAHGLGIDALRQETSAHFPAENALIPPEIRSNVTSLAIAGRPNVGKSSLLNALTGEERVIVSDVPGTTRDAIDTMLTVGSRQYRIIDTAGLRRRGHVNRGPESLAVMASRRQIQKADVVLVVMDSTEAPTMQDLHVAGVANESMRPFMVLLNKWDLAGNTTQGEDLVDRVKGRLRFAPFAPLLTISARTGFRVGKILGLVDKVHAQATRRFTTGRLNNWLTRAVVKHAPPSVGGGELKLYYMVQTAKNPPSFLIFTNRVKPPHFSYRRYIENSLRETFSLSMSPVLVRYRKRPRDARNPSAVPTRPRRRRV